jgi:hypothetical protein
MTGADVAELQQVLMRLGFAIPARERREQTFGVVTAQAVAAFQTAHDLLNTAVVDEATTAALDLAVADLADQTLLVSPPPRRSLPPIPGADEPGPAPAAKETTAAQGRANVPPQSAPEPAASGAAAKRPDLAGPATPPSPRSLPGDAASSRPEDSASPELARLAALAARFLQLGAAAEEQPGGARVSGTVYFDNGGPAAGITLRVYHRGFGDSRTLLGEQVTDAAGRYALDHDLDRANLDVRVVTAEGTELPLADTHYGASRAEVLNLVAPVAMVAPPAPEWQRLQADLGPYLAGADLAQARESGDRADVTLLHRATGWDARVVALAAAASRLSAETGIAAPALYAALRAGLPTDARQLAEVGAGTLERALRTAASAGVVALADGEVGEAVTAFRRFARATRRANVAPGALSSHGDMLIAAGLSAGEQDRFDEVYTEHAGDPQALWAAAEQRRLPVGRLRLTGKLGYLTRNNAELTTTLLREVDSPEQLGQQLAAARLYDPAQWASRIEAAAGEDGLDRLVPPAYPGQTVRQRRDAYAEDLARKVRLSFPTQVVTQMVAAGELPLDPRGTEAVTTVLTRAADHGFRLGRTPLGPFLRTHAGELFAGMPPEQVTAATEQVATLQRLYQITPSDHALKILLAAGFTSARQVADMAYEKFVTRYGEQFASIEQAKLVWKKAQQVSVVVHSFFGQVKQAQNAPAMSAMDPGSQAQEQVHHELLKQYPTIESLLGSQDFCACEHCRSVLSPAAYLVDLLKFLDPDPLEWTGDLAQWKTGHGGAPYPFPDLASWDAYSAATPDPVKELTPYQVLNRRRPDLPELPLTCENTHTALPYIDLVNEILEYWVAHGELDADAVRDTGSAQTPDLLAEPQHLVPAAYDTLAQSRYPLGLPFDLWRETVRRFLAHFDAPLWRLLAALSRGEELYPAYPSSGSYGTAAVHLERLGLPPADYRLLTDADPLTSWYGLYGYPTAAAALSELSNARTLARRLAVSYQELVTLVRSGFVNPKLHTLVALRRLEVEVEDVLRFKQQPGYPPFTATEHAEFAAHLAERGGTAWLEQAWTAGEFGQVLVLADPDPGCGFEHTTLRYADGTPADPMAYLTLNYLVRIWRRLGWTIAETDRALDTFLPSDPDPRTGGAIGSAMASALLGIAHADELAELFGGAGARRRALFVWSDLDEHTYRELFLTRSVLSGDTVFDHPEGQYLRWHDGTGFVPFGWDPDQPEDPAAGNVPLASHLGAVQAALKLSAGDVSRVLAATGTTLADAPLNIATLSTLHRWMLMARALRLPVTDLVTLVELTRDPFTPPPDGPVPDLAHDYPLTRTLRFTRTARDLADSGLTIADLDFLARHRFDPVGRFRAAATPPLPLLRTLSAEIERIGTEHPDPTGTTVLTDGQLRSELALVLPADVVESIGAVLAGTADASTLVGGATVGDLLATHLLHAQVGTEVTGFLTAAQLDQLLAPAPPGLDPGALQQHATAKRNLLAAAFLPYLRQRLVRATVIAALAADSGAEPALVAVLLSDATLLADPAHPGQPLLDAFAAAGARGIDTTTGPDTFDLDCWVQLPAGTYHLAVACEHAGTWVTVRLDHLPDPVLDQVTTVGAEELSAPVELPSGTYRLTVRAQDTGAGEIAVSVQGEGLASGPLDRLTVHPHSMVRRLWRAHLLVVKVLRLAAVLRLTERELRLLAGVVVDGLDLSALPAEAGDATSDAAAASLVAALLRVAGYVRLRDELGADPADLVELLARSRRAFPADADPGEAIDVALAELAERFGAISRNPPAAVRLAAALAGAAATATVSGGRLLVVVPAFADEQALRRLWEVLLLAGRLGVGVDALERWATPTPDFDVARDLRDTVKARYEQQQWRRVAQPISDRLRQARRDALVAWTLHHGGFASTEQLFEHFLIDPGMEPVVHTSRLRLAVSSVQTFIQRCLLNLERQVHPSALNAAHWQWMRRYRVWEANRKIFLWPENWLHPEFRDDKSHLFTALEGALLADDVTADRAEEAFHGYLRGLEEIARLDVRSVYLQERPDPADNVVHVVARTFTAPHKYFYRSYGDRMWTPWVPVGVEIEGDHLAAVIWRERLHLFWVTFLDKHERRTESRTPSQMLDAKISSADVTRIVQVHLHWTEYFQGEWTEPGATGLAEALEVTVPKGFESRWEFLHITRDTAGGTDALMINISGHIDRAFRLASKLSPPTTAGATDLTMPVYPVLGALGQWFGMSPLAVAYAVETTQQGLSQPVDRVEIRSILGKGSEYRLRLPGNRSQRLPAKLADLISPLFYQDHEHTFYIEPTLTEKTLVEWDSWIDLLPPEQSKIDWELLEVEALTPRPGPPDPIGPIARYQISQVRDWLVQPATTVHFGDRIINSSGGMR